MILLLTTTSSAAVAIVFVLIRKNFLRLRSNAVYFKACWCCGRTYCLEMQSFSDTTFHNSAVLVSTAFGASNPGPLTNTGFSVFILLCICNSLVTISENTCLSSRKSKFQVTKFMCILNFLCRSIRSVQIWVPLSYFVTRLFFKGKRFLGLRSTAVAEDHSFWCPHALWERRWSTSRSWLLA